MQTATRQKRANGLENIPITFHVTPMGSSKIHNYSSLIATSLAAGIILTIMGPYGTLQFPVLYRALFWVGLCFAGGLGTAAVNLLLSKHDWTLRSWHRVLLQSLGATLIVWICFFALNIATQGPPPPSFYITIPFYIWVISIVICGIGELMRIQNTSPKHTAASDTPAIYERLKPALRRSEIYALSAEDHYVRVHTSKGDDLILMRLADAIKETAPLPGLQIHRSWWAAESGVKNIRKDDGKLSIILHNDIVAPVSRGRAKSVREANWV